MARVDRERVEHAQFVGAATGVRDAVVLADRDAVARSRFELPQLWDRIDRLIELADG